MVLIAEISKPTVVNSRCQHCGGSPLPQMFFSPWRVTDILRIEGFRCRVSCADVLMDDIRADGQLGWMNCPDPKPLFWFSGNRRLQLRGQGNSETRGVEQGPCECGSKLNSRGKPQALVHVSTYRNPFWWILSHSHI